MIEGKRTLESTSVFPISFDFKEILGSHGGARRRRRKRRRSATTSRDHRGGIPGISPIKIDGRQDGGGARKWSSPGSSAEKVLTRNVLWCGSFANWNRLSGAGSTVFPRRRVPLLIPITPFPPSLSFPSPVTISRGWKRLTQLPGALASPLLGYSYFTGKARV